jgi:Predicted periplasmic protein
MKMFLLSVLLVLRIPLAAQDKIVSYTVSDIDQIRFFWKPDSVHNATTIHQLNSLLAAKDQKLIFAMNGGMFQPDYSPVGLYIQNHRQIKPLNKASGGGNFGMKPNGVFYITSNNEAVVCKTEAFKAGKNIRYATQSGPMLLINGAVHPSFTKGSSNNNIRNGVGILPNGQVLFAISRVPVNFYDFAMYFKEKGCKQALYLDGAISQMYCPEIRMTQQSMLFGVIIGVVQTP